MNAALATLTTHQRQVMDGVLAHESAQRRHVVISLSGAHAYGFPSPDSDLDLKCVHLAPTESLLGFPRVQGFVVFHLRHDGARFMITLRQAFEVAGQVRLDLALCLHHKAQAQAVAQPAGHQPQAECAGVPERIEQ